MSYDNVCKFLIEHYPTAFIKWLAKLVSAISKLELKGKVEILKTELSSEPIRTDFVALLQTLKHIVHIEFQVDAPQDIPMEIRMLEYYARLVRIHRVPIIQIVILLKNTKATRQITDQYESDTTFHRFNVVRLWELDSDQFMGDPALLPFAILAKCGNKKQHLQQVASKIAAIRNLELKAEVVACSQVIAGLHFDKDFIKHVFKGESMRESVIYQEIIEEGLEEGKKLGLQQGLQQGESKLVKRLLFKRFGSVSGKLQNQIDRLSLPQVEALGEALLDFKSTKDLKKWLDSAA